jgi:DNA polymerase III subunit alpha
MTFIHLHTASQYSLLRGVSTPAALVAAAVQQAMPALALADHADLYGAVPFYQACRQAGIQPIYNDPRNSALPQVVWFVLR